MEVSFISSGMIPQPTTWTTKLALMGLPCWWIIGIIYIIFLFVKEMVIGTNGILFVNPIIHHPQNSPQMGSNPSPNGRWIGIGFSMVFHITDHSLNQSTKHSALLTHWHHRSNPGENPFHWPDQLTIFFTSWKSMRNQESNPYSTYSTFILPSGKNKKNIAMENHHV